MSWLKPKLRIYNGECITSLGGNLLSNSITIMVAASAIISININICINIRSMPMDVET
jgi:hypothetical protein